MAQQILIKNGRIWDGNAFQEGDILTEDDKISRIGPNITHEKAFVFDAAGMIVSAGLVDSHMHIRGLSGPEYAISAEAACFPFGVTAAVDAGSRLGDRRLVEQLAVKTLVFTDSKIENNRLNREVTAARLAQYGDKAVGLKMFFDSTSKNVWDITPLQEVCSLAREWGLKVMVHCSNSPVPMLDIVKTLAPGDILTHVYHGGKHTCLEEDFAAYRLAKEKGVVLDAAFAGFVHTNFDVLRKAFAAGCFPDTVSTDITKSSAYKRGGRYGLTMAMSMARTAGMAEEDILRSVTSQAAKALGKEGVWGSLRVGGPADISVLDDTDEPFRLADKAGNVLESKKGYRCRLTVADGVVVHLD